nr:copia protein [Tanacetum cinerariifolium]
PSDTPVCYLCTYEQCGNILNYGTCLNCNSGSGNSFTYDPILEPFNGVQISPNPPPQCHFNIYLCHICESNSHYGYECSQRIPLVYKPKPCYIQNFNDNDYSHDLPEEQAAKAQNWKLLVCYDDDDEEEISNFLQDNIISGLPPCSAITPNEHVDSLGMGDEHLNTILATKSDELIKSCVENLVPNPSESEGENGCDVLACFTTFSNIFFDAEYEFDSSDDQTLSDEDFPKKIFSNPLFEEEIISTKIHPYHFDAESNIIESMLNHDSSIISSSLKIDSLLDEFAGKLTLLKAIPPRIDKTDCHPENEIHLTKRLLYDNSSPRPPEEFVSENSDDDPMPPGIEEDDDDSERDILILEELPSNQSLSLSVNKSFYFDIPSFSRPPAKPPDGNTGILNIKMMGDNSKQKYSWKCEDSIQRILSSKSLFPQLQLGIILLHLAGSQPMLKSSYKAEDDVIISIPPLVGGVADVVVEIKGTGFWLPSVDYFDYVFSVGCQKPGRLADEAGTMTLDTHNWSSSAHKELHKIVKDEIFLIVNQVDARVQNFKIQFLKEAAKLVGDFKSLAKEADESLAKHKEMELEIKHLLRAVVNQDIMSVVQNTAVGETSNLQTELERFIDADHSSHVYKLKKALYGLKQSPKAWYGELLMFHLQNHFFKGTIDLTLFIKRFDDDILVVQVYVDDIIFNSTHPSVPTKSLLNSLHQGLSIFTRVKL